MIAVDAVPPEHHLGRRRVRPGRHPPADDRQGAGRARRRHGRAPGRQRHPAGHRRPDATVKETNVIGTMQLLGACQKAPTVQPPGGEVHARACTAPRPATRRSSPRRRRPSRCPAAASPRTRSRSRDTYAASPAAARMWRWRCCASPTSSGRAPTRRSRSTSRCRCCPRSSATTRGCSSSHEDDVIEVLLIAALEPRARHAQQRHVQHRRRRGAAAVADRAAARQADGAGAAARRHLGRRSCCARPASRTSRPSRSGCSPTAGWWTPRQMRETLGFTPKFTTAGDLRGLRAQPRPRAAAARAAGSTRRPARRAASPWPGHQT